MSISEKSSAVTHKWWVLTLVCMAMFMGVLDSTSVYAALPVIATDLGFAAADVQWVITAFGVSIGGLLLVGGRLADHLGRRPVFIAAVGLFAAASLTCGLAVSSEMLIAGRILQGMGAALMTPAGLSILTQVFPEGPDRNRALGIWGGLGGTGASVGLLLGGVLTHWTGWTWIFYTNVPVCLLVMILSLNLIPPGRRIRQRLDLLGALTATVGLTLLLLAVFRIADAGLDQIAARYGLGAVLLAGVFVVVERRSSAPLVPLRIFARPSLVGGNAVIVIAGVSVDGLLIILTLYAQQVLGFSALQFGLTMTIMTVTSVLAVIGGQHLVTRSGFRLVAFAGMILMLAALILLSRLLAEGSRVEGLLAGLVVFGAGMGAAFVAGQIAALAGVDQGDAGLAAGIAETSFAVGTTLGAAVASAIAVGYASHVAEGMISAGILTEGFSTALLALAGLSAVGAVLAGVLLRTPAGERTEV